MNSLINWKLVFGEVCKLLFSFVKREYGDVSWWVPIKTSYMVCFEAVARVLDDVLNNQQPVPGVQIVGSGAK